MSKELSPTFLRPRIASQYLGICRTQLHTLSETDPDFPRKIIISPRHVGWMRDDLDRWLSVKRGG
jgi:predicted DNA-binding transcriptional regulator AlpA